MHEPIPEVMDYEFEFDAMTWLVAVRFVLLRHRLSLLERVLAGRIPLRVRLTPVDSDFQVEDPMDPSMGGSPSPDLVNMKRE